MGRETLSCRFLKSNTFNRMSKGCDPVLVGFTYTSHINELQLMRGKVLIKNQKFLG